MIQDSIFETASFHRIFDEIQNLISFTHVAVFFLEGTEVTLVAYRGPILPDRLRAVNFDISDFKNLDTILSTSAPLLIQDMESDDPVAIATRKDFEKVTDNPFSYIRSFLGFPLFSEDRIYAFLELVHEQRFFYCKKDLEIIQAYLEKSAYKIEQATLSALLSRNKDDFGELFKIDQVILTNLNL